MITLYWANGRSTGVMYFHESNVNAMLNMVGAFREGVAWKVVNGIHP